MNHYPFAPPPPAPRPVTQSASGTYDTRGGYAGRGGRGGFDNRRGRGGPRGNNHHAFSQHSPSTHAPLIPSQLPATGVGANGAAPSFLTAVSYPNGYGSWAPAGSMTGHAYPQYPQAQAQVPSYYNAYGQPATANVAQSYPQQTAYSHNAAYSQHYAHSAGMPHIPNQSASSLPNTAPFSTPAFTPQFPPPGQHSTHNQHRGGNSGFHSRPKSFPNSFPGQKRKREQDLSPHSNIIGKPGSSGPSQTPFNPKRNRNDRPKVQAPPAVPNFGFAGLPKKPEIPAFHSNRPRKDNKKHKKRKTNQLGLTPKAELHEDSDGDLEDEEAAFAKTGLPPSIQFNGQSVSLTLPAEVKAWIADRKKNFPTRARIAQKKAAQEAAMSRQHDHSRLRIQQDSESKSKPVESISREEKQRLKMEKHLEKANRLRLKLAKTTTLATSATPHSSDDRTADLTLKIDEGDAALSEGTIQDGNALLPGAAAAISDASSSSDSSSDSDDAKGESSGDEPPEALSIKKPVKQEQPPVAMPKKTPPSKVLCKYFLRDGNCRRRDCRFSHKIEQVDRKLTLFEKLTQDERHNEQLKALEMIKSLGDSGFLQ